MKTSTNTNLFAWMLVVTVSAIGVAQQPVVKDAPGKLQEYSILESNEENETASGFIRQSAANNSNARQSIDAGESIDRILTQLALDAIPHSYTDDKKWGKQEERWDGIKWKRDGLRISTKRRKKMVNHGTWRKYSTEFINPKEEFSVQVKDLHKLDNGKTGFNLHFTAHLKLSARQSKWVKGVQLYSLSAEGHTKIRLAVACELGITMDITKFPPDLIFQPKAIDADVVVDEFRIDRISKAGGEFAQQMTRAVRKQLDEKIAEKEVKLVEKINKQLTKKKDKLRLSISDAVSSKFATKEARALLPVDIQKAIEGNKPTPNRD